MSDHDQNFLRQLREAARLTPSDLRRKQLQDAASEVEGYINRLHDDATKETMQFLVGAWTRATKLLETDMSGPHSSRGGRLERPPKPIQTEALAA